MRILFVHRDLGTGSVGKIVEQLYFGAKNNGIECKVVYGGCINKSNIPPEDIIPVNTKNGIRCHAFLSRLTDKSGFYGRKHTKKLIRVIKDFCPDIIHIHGCYGYWVDIKSLYSFLNKQNIRVINTLHSCWDFTGHCCYFTKAKCEKWKTQCHHCQEKRNYPSSLLVDNSYSNYLVKKGLFSTNYNLEYVAPSEWMQRCFCESFLKRHKITIINNGIDLDIFKKTFTDVSKYGILDNTEVVLGVASIWSERKGLNDFVELSEILPDGFQVVVVGVTDKQIKKLPKKIIGIKRTESQTDLAALYTRASVFFNPTYEDNYPTVNLEAIACGTPVITYSTGGSPEIIEKTGFGKVIKFKDYQEIISFIKSNKNKPLVLDSDQIKNLSNKKMINDYLDLYADR